MPKPVVTLKSRIKKAIQDFEVDTGQTIKSLSLGRLDQPVIHEGEMTDLIDITITIK